MADVKKNCPSGVSTVEIFLRAKSILRKIQKLSMFQKSILKLLLLHPHLITKLSPILHFAFKIGTKEIQNDIYQVNFKLFGDRYTKSIKKTFFTESYGGINKAKNEKKWP